MIEGAGIDQAHQEKAEERFAATELSFAKANPAAGPAALRSASTPLMITLFRKKRSNPLSNQMVR